MEYFDGRAAACLRPPCAASSASATAGSAPSPAPPGRTACYAAPARVAVTATARTQDPPDLQPCRRSSAFLDANKVATWSWYTFDLRERLRLIDPRVPALASPALLVRRSAQAQLDRQDTVGKILDEEHRSSTTARVGHPPAGVAWIDPHFKDISVVRAERERRPSAVRREAPGQRWSSDVLQRAALEDAALAEDAARHHVRRARRHLRPRPCRRPPKTTIHGPFQRYGARVPAIVVSPHRVRAGASTTQLFDHTSIIKTILAALLS